MEKIKELREKTGAGMVDCKKALDESKGDIELAIEILRKKGIAKAAKRGDRDMSEGVIRLAVSDDKTQGFIVEINSETDFVARNEKFLKLSDDILRLIREKQPSTMEELLALPMEKGTVTENLELLSGTIGEKLGIRSFDILKSDGTVFAYSHMAGRIGVLVAIDKKNEDELAKNMAMQVAAANPKYLDESAVPAEEIGKEKEVYRELLLKEGKPEEMIDRIMVGKINKYFEEVCLVKQEYIMEDKKKVEEILNGVKVEKFVRYSL